MIKKSMKLLFAKNNDWIEICRSFGLDYETSRDLVQEMYIKIQLKLEKGLDISYKEHEINYYYIYLTLRTMFIDLKRKGKNIKRVGTEKLRATQTDIDYEGKYKVILEALDKMYWYDKKVFLMLNQEDESVASLSRKTGIPYYSLYNTYNKVKEKLKKLL